MNRVLDYVFLRLFALTLGRSYRNLPDNACDDAIMLTGVVCTAPLVLIFVALAAAIPYVGKRVGSMGAVFVVLLVVVPVMYSVNKKFTSYRRNPGVASRYGSRTQRAGTFAVLISLLMTAPIAIGLLLGVLLH
jgi:hypothetical protein